MFFFFSSSNFTFNGNVQNVHKLSSSSLFISPFSCSSRLSSSSSSVNGFYYFRLLLVVIIAQGMNEKKKHKKDLCAREGWFFLTTDD